MLTQLDKKDIWFPNPRYCIDNEEGLLAYGGDLSVERLLLAYSNGIFPWFDFKEREEILWWCPLERFVIMPEEIHISHSMKTLMNKQQYSITFDTNFDAVIETCGNLRSHEEGAWLGGEMIPAYKQLFKNGYAHSVEVTNNSTGKLCGGLYGVMINRVFAGESMFSLEKSASKLALIFLAEKLKGKNCLIDCQFETPHLKSMGGKFISYDEYMKYQE